MASASFYVHDNDMSQTDDPATEQKHINVNLRLDQKIPSYQRNSLFSKYEISKSF